MTMQRVQDQDNGINIKFGANKNKKGSYRLVSQHSENEKKSNFNGTNKQSKLFTLWVYFNFFLYFFKKSMATDFKIIWKRENII